MWQNIKEIACGLAVAALQLTSKPMPKRKQCLGCLSAHHNAGLYCAVCETALVVHAVLEAGAVIVGGALLALAIWAVVAS